MRSVHIRKYLCLCFKNTHCDLCSLFTVKLLSRSLLFLFRKNQADLHPVSLLEEDAEKCEVRKYYMTGGCCFTCTVLDGAIGSGTFLSYTTVVGFLLADLQRSRTLSPQRKPVRHVSLELTTLPRRYPYTSPLGIRKVRHASVEEVSFNCVSEDYHHEHHNSMPCVHELKIYFESLSKIEDRGLTLRGMPLVCHFKSPSL